MYSNFFWGYWQWNYVLDFFSQHVHYWYIGNLLIFIFSFCILTLCWTCLPDLRVCWWSLLGSFKDRIMSSANMDDLISSFSIFIPFIYFFLLPYCLTKNSALYWIRVKRVAPHLISDVRRNVVSFSTFSAMLAACLVYVTFIVLRQVSSHPSFSKAFSMNNVGFCQSLFLIIVLIKTPTLDSTRVLHCASWLIACVQPSSFWNETSLVRIYDLFDVLLNLVFKYLINNFCVYVHQWNFLFCCILTWFWYSG
jgi:hypothetical protein